MNDIKPKFFNSVDRITAGHNVLCEAIKAGFHACFEFSRGSSYDSYETVEGMLFIDTVPAYANEGKFAKKCYAVIKLTDEERERINALVPRFIEVYNDMYYNTAGDGGSIKFTEHSWGEGESWDGRDFATYDGGWGESEITDCEEDPNDILTRDFHDSYEVIESNVFDDFPELEKVTAPDGTETTRSEADARAIVKQCYDIVINRQTKDLEINIRY